MDDSKRLHEKILQAIKASENIIVSLRSGNIEDAERYDEQRADCFREMSKYKNYQAMISAYNDDIDKLNGFDKIILRLSQGLRDEVLTHILKEQTNRLRHVQYAQHQQLLLK